MDKNDLADAIIHASGEMPDAVLHKRWLLGLDECALKARLKIVRSEEMKDPYRRVPPPKKF